MVFESYYGEFLHRDWQETTEGGPVRFAVVGMGSFARRRAIPALVEADLCEPTVVAGWTADHAQPVAEEFEIETAIGYDEFHDGVAADEYDAVYVATPNATHLEYGERAARLGKHVLCEKPLEATVDRARRLVDVCADEDVVLMTGYRMQAEPVVRRMRDLVADGFIGDPVQVHGKFSNPLRADPAHKPWRLDPDLAGGGALMDLGIYPLNTARFILGTDPISVFGSTETQHEAFDAVDEHVSFQLRFPNDVSASCTASFNAYPSSRLAISGTDGEIIVRSPFGGVVPHEIIAEREDMLTKYTGPPVDEVVEEFEYFAHCLLTDSTPGPDGRDGVVDLIAIEAIYESEETDCAVDLTGRLHSEGQE